jgi:hypothetical protein
VIGHEAEGVADPLAVLYNIGKDIEKPTSIGIVEKDIGSSISPGSDVVNSSGILDSQRTSHRGIVSVADAKNKTPIFCAFFFLFFFLYGTKLCDSRTT